MPRSLWNGTIAFGEVAVPIKLFSAVESKTVHFHEVHIEDGSRIEHRPYCTKHKRVVPRDEIVKGFELSSGRYVVIDDEEIAAASGTRTRIIDVEHFVPAADIDPVFYEKAYFLGSRDDGADTYRLLHDALRKTGRAAIGRFTFHTREYLAAIRPWGDILVLHTIRFADELVPAKELDKPRAGRKPKPQEIKMAQSLVGDLSAKFVASAHHDEYRKQVLAAIRDKGRGKEIEEPQSEPVEAPGDLMDALRASLKGAKRPARAATRKPATRKKAKA